MNITELLDLCTEGSELKQLVDDTHQQAVLDSDTITIEESDSYFDLEKEGNDFTIIFVDLDLIEDVESNYITLLNNEYWSGVTLTDGRLVVVTKGVDYINYRIFTESRLRYG